MAGIRKSRRGRRGAIRSAAMGILAVIIVIGFVNFWGLPKKVAQSSFETANKFTDDLGLDELISLPKITEISIAVGGDGALDVSWKANKDGRRILEDGSTDIRVTFLRRELPEAQLEKYCIAYKLNTGPENDKEENEADAKGIDCEVSSDGIGSAVLKGGADGSKPAPGGDYTVIVAVKEEKEAGFGEGTEKSYKFYTEEYVELLDKPIQGCDFPPMNNCNVIECKKTIMNRAADTSGVLGVKGEIERITNEVVSGTCAAYDSLKSPMVSFAACAGPEDVDFVNTKFARLRMFRAAYADDVAQLKSESEYVKFADRINDFKQLGLIESLVCSNGEGLFKGAYGHLSSVGWAAEGTFDKWGNDVTARLDNVLTDEVNPGIVGLRADGWEGYKISLGWSLAATGSGIVLGENKVKSGSYKISRFHKRWERGITPENQRVLQKENIFAGKDPVTGELRTSFDTESGLLAGKHEFEARIFSGPDATGSELFLAKAATGLFDDAYIETYKGGVEGDCVTKGLGKDPVGLHECNVDAQKREELKALRTPAGKDKRDKVFAAIGKAGVDAAKCKYEATGISLHYGLSDECTPEEVDRVWKNYMAETGRPTDYNCVLPLGSEAKNVCIVKRQTVSTLLDRGWKDLRASKGWEEDV